VAQVALSLTLVVAAVLFLRTFKNLLTSDTGYDRAQVVTARVDPQLAGFTPQTLPALYDRLLTAARAIHGVQFASLAMSGPATGSARTSSIVIEGLPRLTGDAADVREEYVGPDYFATIGMPVMRGRTFMPNDVGDKHQVAVVNEAMVKHFFAEVNPIGRHFDYDSPGMAFEIVGVVRDAHVDGSRAPVPPMVFYPLAQRIEYARNLYVRVTGDTVPVIAALRGAVASADRGLAVREVITLDELSGRLLTNERLVSNLTGIFGMLALAVACLGLYGTMAYSVARRTGELGVRLALGASPAGLRWLVLRESLVLVAIGAALGLALAVPLVTQLNSLLYGLSPRDPATLAGSAAALAVIGLLAGAIPAWRASRVSPISALRAD
jgi:predicted permease